MSLPVLEAVDLDWGSLDTQAHLSGSLEDPMAQGVCNCLEALGALEMKAKRTIEEVVDCAS